MTKSRLALAISPVWVLTLTLSIVFQSTDPGAKGVIADVSFFTWLACTIVLLVLGALVLVRARGSRGTATG